MDRDKIFNASEAVQELLSRDKKLRYQWDDNLTDSDTIINPETNEEMEIIMLGDNGLFDVDEFYQYVIDDNGHIYKAYYNYKDEDGNDIDDLGDIDYTHPYRIKDITELFTW